MKRTQALACISLLLDDEEEDENDYWNRKEPFGLNRGCKDVVSKEYIITSSKNYF